MAARAAAGVLVSVLAVAPAAAHHTGV